MAGMKDQYAKWIEENVADAYGKCAEVTERMAAAFPELQRIRGHYYCPIWGDRAHWWLVTEDGTIIDPTKQQFPSKGIGEYVPWDESQREPTGRCPNCGSDCYEGDYFCSQQCGNAYVDYCQNYYKD